MERPAMPAVMSPIRCMCVSNYILSGDMPELPQQWKLTCICQNEWTFLCQEEICIKYICLITKLISWCVFSTTVYKHRRRNRGQAPSIILKCIVAPLMKPVDTKVCPLPHIENLPTPLVYAQDIKGTSKKFYLKTHIVSVKMTLTLTFETYFGVLSMVLKAL